MLVLTVTAAKDAIDDIVSIHTHIHVIKAIELNISIYNVYIKISFRPDCLYPKGLIALCIPEACKKHKACNWYCSIILPIFAVQQ